MKNTEALIIVTVAAFLGLFTITYFYRAADNQFDALASIAAAPFGEARSASLSWQPVTFNAPWQKRDSHFAYVFDGKLFTGGGLDATRAFENGKPVYEKAPYFNDIWQTEDGISWQKVLEHSDLPPIRSMSVFELNGKLYGIGGWGPTIGYNRAVFESGDGINWRKASSETAFPPREGMRVLSALGEVYLFGGVNYERGNVFNDVWKSKDGIDWQIVAKNTSWSPRWDHDVAFFQNKFWLVGGMNLNLDGFSDVWFSEDAISWKLATSTAPFGIRQGLALVPFEGAMFVIGGLDAKTNEGKNEIWFSKSGLDWKKTENDTLWVPREDHEAVLFKNKIFLFGGMSTNWNWKNDVWEAVLPSIIPL